MFPQRLLTALVLAPIMIGGIFYLPLDGFAVFIGVIVALGAWEWANLSGLTNTPARLAYVLALVAILAVLFWLQRLSTSQNLYLGVLWLALVWWLSSYWFIRKFPDLPAFSFLLNTKVLLGFVVLVPFWVGLMLLKTIPNSNFWIVFLMLIVWGADIGAYVVGRAIGRRKLAINISPGKSWEGVWGGFLVVMLVTTGAGLYLSGDVAFDLNGWLKLFAVSMVVATVSIFGDLVESILKRHRGIKDSSHLLPGHGGIMDRIDSLTAAVPVFALLIYVVVVV